MSIEAATAFRTEVDQDPALRAEVLARYQAGGMAAVAVLASARGHTFTPADAEAALRAPSDDELSDLELEAVAGGKAAVVAATAGGISYAAGKAFEKGTLRAVRTSPLH